ncbi:MAG: T9SS type A sorting domain-containing protein, partial [Bacteroidia bacterium]
ALQDSANYQWISCTNGFAPVIGATSQTFTAFENGDFAVIVVYNGCADTSACFNVSGLGIEEDNNSNTWLIYPNPNNGNFIISSTQELYFELMDYTGRIISSYHVQNISINVSENLPAGMYFIREKESGNVQKIIVQ